MRLHAQHLARRLPAGSLAEAAHAGLQDSAPRAALLSLHARAKGVGPDDWEDPSLVQLWGPRAAVYVVPADARGAFTLGRLPRDPEAAAPLHRLAAETCAWLDGRQVRYGDVQRAMGKPFRFLTPPTGTIGIRWDTRDTYVFETEPPDQDPEDARLDLGRRFLRWFGPMRASDFARWAGVPRVDAAATMQALASEKAELPVRRPTPVEGVRLLPPGDPYLSFDRPREIAGPGYVGVVLLDGEVVGTWLRQGGVVDLIPAVKLGAADRERVETEALSLPVEAERREVRWRSQ